MAKYIPEYQRSYLTKADYQQLLGLCDTLLQSLKEAKPDYDMLSTLLRKLDQVKWDCERIDRIRLVTNEPASTFALRPYPSPEAEKKGLAQAPAPLALPT